MTPASLAICVIALLVSGVALRGADLQEQLGRLPQVLTSATGQFVVVGHEPGSPQGPPPLSTVRSNHVQLDPGVLAITCEHVKSELLFLLQTNDRWRGSIVVQVNGTASPDAEVGVSASRWGEGWRFKLQLPGQMERTRLVRALVRGMLLEFANRNNPTRRLAEVPLWLQEGLAAQLYAMHGPALAAGIGARVFGLGVSADAAPKIVVNQRVPQSYERNYTELLSKARRHFELFELVEFVDLQLPMPGQLEGFAWETFQHSAHLFVAELLRLPDGRECLLETLAKLKGFLNPQLAFLKAFAGHFPNALAADKWWAVVCVDFKSREADLRWSEARTLDRLKQTLHTPVMVRADTNSVPVARTMMLQDLIRETAFADHRPFMVAALRSLFFVEQNSRRDLARLIRDYRAAIEEYVRAREDEGEGKNSSASSFKLVKRAAIDRLDLLDGIRFDIKLVASPEPEKGVDLDRVERLLSAPVAPLTPP